MTDYPRWPADVAARYRHDGYWRGQVLGSLTADHARTDGGRIAIVDHRRYWTYADVHRAADRLAAGFRRLGIAAGDRVVVQLPNVGAFAAVSIGLFRLGAVPVYALPMHRRSEIVYLCDHAEAVAYVTIDTLFGFDYRQLARDVRRETKTVRHIVIVGDGQEFPALPEVEAEPEALPAPSPFDVAFLLLSGGTTGMPKLIPRTHDDFAYQLRATAEGLAFDRDGVYLASLPVAHNAALGCPGLLGALSLGAKAVLLLSPSPDEAFDAIEREGVTLTTLMPPLIQLWLEAAEFSDVDLSRLLVQVGSARLAPELALRVQDEWGATLSQWFGMAEGLLTFTRLDDPEEITRTTVGRPLSPADEIRVVDESGRDVPAGSIGELLTRGPYTIRGYYKADEYNAVTFTPDGFLRTGDLVSVRPDGNMVVEGRRKDVINRGGEKVSPGEVEDALLLHPGIREVAIVAMPDTVMGERVCAFVVPRGAAIDLIEGRNFLRAHGMADFKLPDHFETIAALPKTKVGKVDRGRLKQLIAQTLASESKSTV
jgi:2,3-dihydroxybenzoate-AMP ligase